MNVQIFTPCDAATIENGKLFILGAFANFYVPSFPHAVSFVFCCRICFPKPEWGNKHKVTILLADPDGIALADALAFEVSAPSVPRHEFSYVQLIGAFTTVELSKAGEHVLYLEIDGKEHASYPLFALRSQ